MKMKTLFPALLLSSLSLLACGGSAQTEAGDGDANTGDGDGDTGGDSTTGGQPMTGDGDGDTGGNAATGGRAMTGDGDGDATGGTDGGTGGAGGSSSLPDDLCVYYGDSEGTLGEICTGSDVCCSCGCGEESASCHSGLLCPPSTGPECGIGNCNADTICCPGDAGVCAPTEGDCP